MNDDFPIALDVKPDALGHVLRLLNSTPGVTNIHLQLAGRIGKPNVPAIPNQNGRYGPRGPYKKGNYNNPESQKKREATRAKVLAGIIPNSREIVAQTLAKSAMPLHTRVLGEAIAKRGFATASVHSAITKMLSEKDVEWVKPGTYRLTKKGEKAYLGNNGNQKVTPTGKAVDNNSGVRLLVLSALSGRKFGHQEILDMLKENGYNINNMYKSVKKMREEGLVRRDGDEYEITDKGLSAIAPKDPEMIHHIIDTEHGEMNENG